MESDVASHANRLQVMGKVWSPFLFMGVRRKVWPKPDCARWSKNIYYL
jgi:hypothetical protein